MISIWDPIVERYIGIAILMKLESTAIAITIDNGVSHYSAHFVPNLPLVIEDCGCKL